MTALILIVIGAIVGITLLALILGTIFRGLIARPYYNAPNGLGGFSAALLFFVALALLLSGYQPGEEYTGPDPKEPPPRGFTIPTQPASEDVSSYELRKSRPLSAEGGMERELKEKLHRSNLSEKPFSEGKQLPVNLHTLQIGAFSSWENAQAFREQCRPRVDRQINVVQEAGQFKVLVGQFEDYGTAKSFERQLERMGINALARKLPALKNTDPA